MLRRVLFTAAVAGVVLTPSVAGVAMAGGQSWGKGDDTCVPAPGADCADVDHKWKVDADGKNLEGINLKRAKLHGASLQGTDMSDAKLNRVILKYADLDGAELDGADLRRAKLSNASMTGVDLSEANLTRAALKNVTMDGVTANGADLSGAVIKKSTVTDLRGRGVDLGGAVVTDSTFDNVHITPIRATTSLRAGQARDGAGCTTFRSSTIINSTVDPLDLSGCGAQNLSISNSTIRNFNLSGSQYWGVEFLSGSTADGANFSNSRSEDGARAVRVNDSSMRNANFRGAQMWKPEMIRATMDGSDFSNSVITEGNLSSSSFVNANFFGAFISGDTLESMQGTNIKGINFEGASSSATSWTPVFFQVNNQSGRSVRVDNLANGVTQNLYTQANPGTKVHYFATRNGGGMSGFIDSYQVKLDFNFFGDNTLTFGGEELSLSKSQGVVKEVQLGGNSYRMESSYRGDSRGNWFVVSITAL